MGQQLQQSQRKEVWFFTGSQELYGPQTLAEVAEQSQRLVTQLTQVVGLPVDIVWKPVLVHSDSIQQAVVEANQNPAVVGVIAWMHTFSPAKMWIRGLTKLQKPLLHWHTQINVELPWETIDMDFMNLNQAAHGDREFGYIQTRLRIPRKTVFGHVSNPETTDRIVRWTRAALGADELRNLKVARFGDNMREVAVTEGDKVEAEQRLGVSINTYAVNDLVAVLEQISDAEAQALAAEYTELYDLDPVLAAGGERHDSLLYAAKQEIALRSFLVDGGFGAFTDTFEDLGALRQLPGLAVQRLMADGFGFGGEGDWKTAALVRTAKAMAAGAEGGTSFMEDYTYHLVPGEELLLGSHMLEICPSIAVDRPRVEIHPLGIGAREDPVRLVFNAVTGPGVVVGILDLGNRFRLVANTVELVEPQPLPKLPVARAVWKPDPSLTVSVESWLKAGGPHHTVLSTALTEEEFEDLAEIVQAELVVIGDTATSSSIAKELRWNAPYFDRLS